MAYREMWEIEVQHEELNKYRLIRGSDQRSVEQKAYAQQLAWEEMWEKQQSKDNAVKRTTEAEEAIERLEAILLDSLEISSKIDWDSLIDNDSFPVSKPVSPTFDQLPSEPNESDEKYQPHLTFLDMLFTKARRRKDDEAKMRFNQDHDIWEKKKQKTEQKNSKKKLDYSISLENWDSNKHKFKEKQDEKNRQLLDLKKRYFNCEYNAVSAYVEAVLSNSVYPEYFPKEWNIEYKADNKTLIVDYSLPDIDCLPTIKEIKYIISRNEFKETKLSNVVLNKLFDGLLYKIALRTIHELYEADEVDALHSIVFNGWVNSINKATGRNANSCIMSLQASKGEFLSINLRMVEPKACFKQLKGIASSKLHILSPVAPIISIDKEDSRFVSAYDVVDGVEESDNLAAMDWQDFEHLIREIFEKEFVSSGGDVKITQASRDGGVDAIAFDPDPIRGGKIVIQAKRYTNIVGVSAVRDLYGTTVNEGATKGILVTTSDYGPDAYEFAKGKPLTLLNGGNLLHLLEKHGHRAIIDLKAAKKKLSEQNL